MKSGTEFPKIYWGGVHCAPGYRGGGSTLPPAGAEWTPSCWVTPISHNHTPHKFFYTPPNQITIFISSTAIFQLFCVCPISRFFHALLKYSLATNLDEGFDQFFTFPHVFSGPKPKFCNKSSEMKNVAINDQVFTVF